MENYHICPFPACGKKFTSDFKLKCHIKAHEKVFPLLLLECLGLNSTMELQTQFY
jgi:hypothetical protein